MPPSVRWQTHRCPLGGAKRKLVLHEMYERQGLPWNNGRINDYHQFPALNKLFGIINSGIPKEDFMFQGDLYRIHTSYGTLSEYIDPSKERLIGKVYENKRAFSKSYDFTRSVFYKVPASSQAVIFHVNTGSLFGIDVNQFYKRYGLSNARIEDEMEILFPLTKETLVKEYWCTPNQFKHYMRNH